MAQGLPILVVEDDPNLREAVCDTLELAGQAVISAGSGEAALELPGRDSHREVEGNAVVEERDEHGIPRLPG